MAKKARTFKLSDSSIQALERMTVNDTITSVIERAILNEAIKRLPPAEVKEIYKNYILIDEATRIERLDKLQALLEEGRELIDKMNRTM